MKLHLSSLLLFFLLFNLNGYTQKSVLDLAPPYNLDYTIENQVNVFLDWNAPGNNSTEYLKWHTGETGNSFGFFLGPEHFKVAAEWNTDDLVGYNGWELRKLKFIVSNPAAILKLKVWTGENVTEIYSQDITTFNAGQWTEIALDNPVVIDADLELRVGLDIDMPFGSDAMGCDYGPAVDGSGNLIEYQGSWYNGTAIGVDCNWALEAFVAEGGKSEESLIGYNVYRNNNLINDNPVDVVNYTDYSVPNGDHEYYVTAIYEDGESEPSNTVDVSIEFSGVLNSDSLALVALYNSTYGAQWTNSTNWLETNVDEWFGVTVENGRVVELNLSNNNLDDNIDDEFTNLNALTYLDLSHNNINLPIYMANMIGLEFINVSDNDLYAIPEDISQCTNLEVIICENNSMNYIPQNIGSLDNLVELDISGSTIGYIAPTLGNLSSIEIIDFSNNGIYNLPDNFGNLTTLTYLDLSHNNISEYNYNNIDNLTYLNLNNNLLTSVPEFIGNLSALAELRIGGNDLQEIPFGFENLNNLVVFEAFETGISEVPQSLFEIASLEEINLGNNNIQTISETIATTELQVLKLNNNQLDVIPEDYFDLELTDLWLNNNSLEFGSLEPFVDQVSNEFTYDNQAILLQDTTIDVEIGENFSFTVEVSGDFNTYQWYKGPVMLADQTSNTLTFEDISDDEIANYRLKVNNTLITDLELSTAYIELNLVTALDELDQNDISVYPNPSVDFIQIESPEEIKEIKVYNISGQLILTRTDVKNSRLHISTSDLRSGVYSLEISIEDQILRKRFIKK